MSYKQLQEEVDNWAQQFEVPYWQPLAIMTRLTEESGELAREINHRFGPKKKKSTEENAEIADEIADIFFTLICLANSQQINLDDAWDQCMQKLKIRDKDRFEKKQKPTTPNSKLW